MKKVLITLAMVPLLAAVLPAQRPWQQITVPSVRDVAANFRTPPHEFGAIQPFMSWNGPDAKERMARIVEDLDRLQADGVYMVNMSPGRGTPAYLSKEHMDQVKFVVQEAKKRGMKLWLQDESDYPSGFAGGNMIRQYPQLCMQGIVADIRVRVAPGQRFSMPVPPDTLGILALETTRDQQLHNAIQIPLPADGQLKWIVPNEGSTPNEPHYDWEVVFVRHIYISSPTRNFNREDGTRAKDGLYSLIDYLDPNATRAFLNVTHETYRQAVGDEFGNTILGFFGDEPDYSINGMPWTPGILEEFQKQKGYDLRPYIPLFFTGKLTDEAQRAKADYWDVWSGIFQNSFFGEQAAWCAKYNVEYLVHLNHEETMMALVRSEGDYFRDNRYVEVPGIDNLSQLVPSAIHTPDGTWRINNNFPKIASSAAHLFGRPKVWTESAGGPGIDGKFQLDFQMVRGVTELQIRVPGGRGPGGEAAPPQPQGPLLALYANRGGYLMAMGRPAAQVGLYHPANSMWMGDEEADRSTTKLGWQLYEHQVEWDYFDEQSLSSVATIADGGFKDLSGQVFRAIVVPSSTVITRTGLERFRAFVEAGGKLIFVGQTPKLVVDKTFLNAKDVPDLSFATLIEPSGDITPRVIAALPKPDVTLDSPWPRLTYTHRSWSDADMYLFFNESDKEESRMATIAGRGQAQVWDLGGGQIHSMTGATAENDSVRFPLLLEPYETKVVVVGPLPSEAMSPEPALVSGTTLAELGGDWTLDLNGKHLTTPLKSWEELGTQSFAGPAIYRKQFTAPTVPAGKHVYLEIADARDYVRIRVNGAATVDPKAWQPYRWDITTFLQPGNNDLQINVFATLSGRGGFEGPPPAAAGAPGAAGAAGGRGGRGGRGQGAPGAAAVYGAVGGGGGRGGTPPVSGLLGPVRLVAR
ncbi:MAG: glycosyl hydrolase [Bryobacteraceae bacterium]